MSELNLAEAAFLAGITKNPSRYSPFEQFENGKARQVIVLDNMVRAEVISPEVAKAAKEQPIEIRSVQGGVKRPAPYFIDYVISALVDKLTPRYGSERGVYDAIYRGGLQIYTTLDPAMQEAAENTLLEVYQKEKRTRTALPNRKEL